MPFAELRSLVGELVAPEQEPEDDPVAEFDTQPTACVPPKPRTSTLDDLIASLQTAPPPAAEASRPKSRKRM